MTIRFQDYFNERMQDPEFRYEYEALEAEQEVMKSVVQERERIGMTQKEFAEKTGLAVSELNELECGYADPTIATFIRLAEGLGMKLKIELQPA